MAAKSAAPAFPAISIPTVNLDALVALQKANIEALAQVQKIFADAAEAAWQLQMKRFDAWKAQAELALKSYDPAKKPDAYVKEAQAAVETAVADAKVVVEGGVKAQREAAQVLASRFVANLNELKALAA